MRAHGVCERDGDIDLHETQNKTWINFGVN